MEMQALQFLYLHNNNFPQSWHVLEHVVKSPALLHLTLFGNEVRTLPGYRHFLVNKRPTLLALDYHLVTDEERMDHVSISGSERFRAMSDYMRIRVGQEEATTMYESFYNEQRTSFSRENKIIGQTPSPVPRTEEEMKLSLQTQSRHEKSGDSMNPQK